MTPIAPPPASDRTGRYLLAQSGPEGFWAFHPNPLPPSPPLAIGSDLQDRLDAGNQALGRLDGITLLLPDPGQFLYTFVRKEAVLSSQIEGTQSSLSDLLLFENDASPGVPREDAQVTANYIAAMNYGIGEILRPRGTPLSARLLRDVHAILLATGRGSEQAPGDFRRDQNWIGGTRPGNARFVPPPWPQVGPAMSDLELTDPPVYGAISRLEEAGILREVTGRQRGKIYVYDQYLALLNEGTEPHLS